MPRFLEEPCGMVLLIEGAVSNITILASSHKAAPIRMEGNSVDGTKMPPDTSKLLHVDLHNAFLSPRAFYCCAQAQVLDTRMFSHAG